MDDTLEDAGIPFLRNGEEIPVHSTPIKGDKVPLPSTRHVAKLLHPRTRRRINHDETDSESIRSVRSTDVKDTKGQRDVGGQRLDVDSGKQVTHKPPYPHPDKLLDISNQDNLRPKVRESSHHTDQFNYETAYQNYLKKYEVDGSFSSSLTNMKTSQSDKRDTGDVSSNSQSKPVSSNSQSKPVSSHSQSKSSSHSPATNESQNAFSSYRHFQKKDSKVSTGDDTEEVSYSVQISHTNSPRAATGTDDVTLDKPSVQIGSVTTTSGVDYREDTGADRQRFTYNSSTYDSRYTKQNSSYKELENNTIARQRQEVQLLVTELKDRDRELSETLVTHQQQLLAWEQDRTRLTSLEKKIYHLEEELQNKSSKLRSAIHTLNAAKVKDLESNKELEKFRSAIEILGSEKKKAESEFEKYKIENSALQNQVDTLSSRLGNLQARETELTINVQSKEKDISYATGQMKELSTRLQQLDLRSKEAQDREKEALKEKEQWKNRYQDSCKEIQKLTEELSNKSNQCARVLEENWSARNQLSLVQKESGEREKCKDDFIESMRVKQERTDKQLKGLRERYEHQLNEMVELQKQVDTFRDLVEKQHTSMDHIHLSQSDRSSVFTPDHSRTKQHTNSSQSRPSQTHKAREPDSSHTHSSGYQSQLSDNQTGFNQVGTSQFVPSGIITGDSRSYQTFHNGVSVSSEITGNQTNLQVTGSQFQTGERNQSPRTQHEEFLWQQSVETNQSQFSGEVSNGSSPLKEKVRRSSLSPRYQKQTASSVEKSRRNSVRIQEPNEANTSTGKTRRTSTSPVKQSAETRRNSVRQSLDQSEANCSTERRRGSVRPNVQTEPSTPPTTRRASLGHQQQQSQQQQQQSHHHHQSADHSSGTRRPSAGTQSQQQQHSSDPSTDSSSQQRVIIKHTTISMYPNDAETDDAKPGESTATGGDQTNSLNGAPQAEVRNLIGACSEIEKEFSFENKLRSFLDDIDGDYDDSIWEEKPDRSQSISGVDCSPSSKLAKLLLESRMMIDTLEKSSDNTHKLFPTANDTLEKPNLDKSKTGSDL